MINVLILVFETYIKGFNHEFFFSLKTKIKESILFYFRLLRTVHRVYKQKGFNERLGKMSSLSGLGNKGEKGKGKFTSININNIYKGKSVETQKSTGKCLFYSSFSLLYH